MFAKIKSAYIEYPASFRVLVVATFIDTLGRFLLFPFFAIYISERFNVDLLQVGFLFAIFSAGDIIGGVIGGALTDKYGRRKIILFGLIVSGISSISMGLVNDLYVFYILAVIIGLLGNFGGPARQAMVSDLLPEEKRAEGFGILRVALNLSAVIGPILGGTLASLTRSYMLLFIMDAICSIITGMIVYLVIPETKPQKLDNKPEETVFKTIIGYKEVLKDGLFLLFLSISAITVLVYMQINSTLSVFLWEVHSFADWYWLLSMNAVMVVILQLWITKKLSKYAPMKMMALGTLFYMVGFGMYGFVSEPYMFFVAMGILTIGEMIAIPVSQSAVASFAPEDKRGRYMAVFGLHWAIPNLFAVILAGLVERVFGANWIWYFAGILCLIAALSFLALHRIAKDRFTSKITPKKEEVQKKEKEEIPELTIA